MAKDREAFELLDTNQILAMSEYPEDSLQEWKDRCPYGVWTCAGGREVMFNRSYWPILERSPPAFEAKVARAGEWIKGIVRHDHFFDDYSSPWRRRWTDNGGTGRRSPGAIKNLTLINRRLTAWGVPNLKPPPLPPKRDPNAPLVLHAADFVKGIKPRPNPWASILGGNP